MIVKISGWQDAGKTSLGIAVIKELIRIGSWFGDDGFKYSDVVANLHLFHEGAHCLTNPQMRLFIKKMVTYGLKHRIILLDEADRLFPARFWHDREQTEALIGLWQDVKLFNWIIYTCHLGTSIDVILRETAQIELEPLYDEARNCIDFVVYNSMYGEVYEDCLEDVMEKIFFDYNRWEVIGQVKPPPGEDIFSLVGA